jgi:hypothetical protein
VAPARRPNLPQIDLVNVSDRRIRSGEQFVEIQSEIRMKKLRLKRLNESLRGLEARQTPIIISGDLDAESEQIRTCKLSRTSGAFVI